MKDGIRITYEETPLFSGAYRLYVSKKVKDPSTLSFLLDSEERMETNLLKTLYTSHYGKELPILMDPTYDPVREHEEFKFYAEQIG